MLDKINQNPHLLFLIDAMGALVSAFLYVVVLAKFEHAFGMPSSVLYYLAMLAGIYALYSFSCYLGKLSNWQPYMKIIAIANLFHCCLTIGLVIFYFQKITVLGMLYFAGELVIVISLAIFELKMAKR